MSAFSPAQLRKLVGKLDRANVHSRTVEGRRIDYIEGWFALSEANAIFGFANWDRETVHFERLFERTRGEMTSCAYSSRVRVLVRAGDTIIAREGTGCGTASARNAADAHERAIKAAETDATKRALATFGNRFGLCLYDKEQAGVSEPALRALEIFCPDGRMFAERLSPEGFCTALRKIIDSTTDITELAAWQQRNASVIDHLRSLAPGLKTQRGEHYADVLERLFRSKLDSAGDDATTDRKETMNGQPVTTDEVAPLSPPFPMAPSRIASGPRIDKAALTYRTVRRLRDKAHLRLVANLGCLVCGRRPCHAHHVRHAQPRGLSQKVSDEFVVPLCFLHHRALHDSRSEELWWHDRGIDPLPISERLWAESHSRTESNLNSDVAENESTAPTTNET